MANLSNINGKFVVEQTTGYVGVGTTDPNYPIEVLNASAEIALNASGASIYRLRSDSTDSFRINKNGVGDRLVINGAGNATFSGSVEFSAGVVRLIANQLQSGYNADSEDSDFWINYQGYQGGTTRYRDFRIGNGKQGQIAFFDGSTSATTFAGNVTTGGQVTVPSGYSVNIGTSRIHSTSTSYLLGGNVGIGTTVPNSKLTIEAAGSQTTQRGITLFHNNTLAQGYISVGAQYTATNGYIDSEIRFGGETLNGACSFIGFATGCNNTVVDGPNSEKMRLTSGGKLGIGTSAPEHKLVVIGTIGFGLNYNGGVYANNTSTSVDENWGLEVQRTANVDDYNTRLKYYPVSGQSRAAGIYDSRNARFSLYSDTNNNPNIIIPNGNVGIGTTSLDSPLSIKGGTGLGVGASGIRVHRPDSFGQFGFFDYGQSSGTTYIGSSYTGGTAAQYGAITFRQLSNGGSAKDTMTISVDNRVGIGIVSPVTKCWVKDNQDSSLFSGVGVERSANTTGVCLNAVGGALNLNTNSSMPLKFRIQNTSMQTINTNGGRAYEAFGGWRMFEYSHSFSLANGATLDLFQNTSPHTDLHMVEIAIRMFHSGRTYFVGSGVVGGYGMNVTGSGSGATNGGLTSAVVSSGIRKLQITQSSSFTASVSVYIKFRLDSHSGINVLNGTLSTL